MLGQFRLGSGRLTMCTRLGENYVRLGQVKHGGRGGGILKHPFQILSSTFKWVQYSFETSSLFLNIKKGNYDCFTPTLSLHIWGRLHFRALAALSTAGIAMKSILEKYIFLSPKTYDLPQDYQSIVCNLPPQNDCPYVKAIKLLLVAHLFHVVMLCFKVCVITEQKHISGLLYF